MILARQAMIAESFGRRAELYDQHADVPRHVAERLLRFLPSMNEPNVLEVGCGTGFFTGGLLDQYKGGHFYVTDLSPEMVSFCHNKFGTERNVRFSVMDGAYPDVDEQYDLITASMVVQWFDNPVNGLKNLMRCLKPGGELYFAALGPESFTEWKDSLVMQGSPSGILNVPHLPGVFNEERFTVDYGDAASFLKALKTMGANSPRTGYSPLDPAALRRVCRLYDQKHQGKITWHIVYGCLTR